MSSNKLHLSESNVMSNLLHIIIHTHNLSFISLSGQKNSYLWAPKKKVMRLS